LSEETREFIRKAKVITPERTSATPLGYRYPVAEEYFGENAQKQLDRLVEDGLMEREFYQRELGCPKCGSINLIVRFHCPKCDSTNMVKSDVIEHWPCGYVGVESDFKDGRCPKCGKKLEKLGVDHAKLGPMYKCLNCGEVFQTPVDRLNCANCGHSFMKDEAKEVILYSYKITPKLEEELDVAIAQKNLLVERLIDMGFEVEPPENLYGRSGLKHDFYLVAAKGTGMLRLRIIIEVLSAAEEVPAEEVFAIYGKAIDLGAYGLIIAAIPRFSKEAKKVMEYYDIAYVEVPTLEESAEAIIKKLKEVMSLPRRYTPKPTGLGWSTRKTS